VNKKEAKKTLIIWGHAVENVRAPDSKKVFCFFFSKKKSFFPCVELADQAVIGRAI
jgi:hypothetical protein